jgi:tetratricopeptide (TPR) repeat protein
VRSYFGGQSLSPERRRVVGSALEGAGIKVWPPLETVDRHAEVLLTVRGGAGKAHPLSYRLRSRWRPLKTWVLVPVVGLITIASGIATLEGAFSPSSTSDTGQPPKPAVRAMNGDLNIAVAPFTVNGRPGGDGIALARDTDLALRSKLARLDPNLRLAFRGPDQVAATGATAPAAEIAARLKADLIVYGNLTEIGDATALTPQFYLNRRKLPSAAELVGGYSFGPQIRQPYSIQVNPQTRAKIRAALLRRIDGLATVFVGVGYYLDHDLTAAASYFAKALSLARGQPSAALMLLFLGNITNQQHRPRRAARYYRAALRRAPGYGRAQFGLGEVSYVLAHGSCKRHRVDASKLFQARRAFTRVPLASSQSNAVGAPRVLQAKVEFGLGQVDLCLSQSGSSPRWHLARREFAAVIDAYRPAIPELRNDAAEAHAGIGLADLNAPPEYTAARDEYQVAADTTAIKARRGFFEGMVGFASEGLGDHAAAATAYRRAAFLTADPRSRRRYVAAARRNAH